MTVFPGSNEYIRKSKTFPNNSKLNLNKLNTQIISCNERCNFSKAIPEKRQKVI